MAVWMPQGPGERVYMLRWAQARLEVRDFGDAYPIGVVRDGELAAVVVYHRLQRGSVELSIAADTPRWATRQAVTWLLGWPFWVFEVRRLTSIIERKNKRSRRLCEGLGFAREGVCRDLFPHDDGVIYGMTRRWWQRSRWYMEPLAEDEARTA